MSLSETPMTRRFLRCIWSETRKAMDAMEDMTTILRPVSEYNLALVTARRLWDAYENNRKWTCRKQGEFVSIFHQQNNNEH